MKHGWEAKKLGEVCDLQNGAAFKSSDYVEFSNTMNFRMSQIRPGGGIDLNNNPKYLPDEFANIYKDYLLKEGDIVIAMTDMATETKILGVPAIVPYDCRNWLLNQRVGKLFNIDKSRIDIAYLKYILVSEPINRYYKSLGRGGLQINIGKQDILNAEIPIPPLIEQKRIVSILDECFTAIDKTKANTEQNLINAKEIFESVLNEKLRVKNERWEMKNLGEVCETGAGGTPLKAHKDYYDGGTVPWLLSGEVSQGEIFGATNFITEKGLKNSSAKLFPLNTVLIAMYGATAGQVGLLRFEACTNQAVCGILPNKKYLPEFLFYYFLSKKEELVAQAVGGAQPNISQIKIKNTLVPVISLQEQQTIVRQLDALRAETQKLEAVYHQKIANLDELKKSVLQRAFAGELG